MGEVKQVGHDFVGTERVTVLRKTSESLQPILFVVGVSRQENLVSVVFAHSIQKQRQLWIFDHIALQILAGF